MTNPFETSKFGRKTRNVVNQASNCGEIEVSPKDRCLCTTVQALRPETGTRCCIGKALTMPNGASCDLPVTVHGLGMACQVSWLGQKALAGGSALRSIYVGCKQLRCYPCIPA